MYLVVKPLNRSQGKGDLVTIDPKICSSHEDRSFTCKRRQDLCRIAKVMHSFTLAM